MAQIVVPWVSTKPVFPAEGSSFGLNGWWPRRRSRSTKFGPGSSPGVNRGRVMWRRRLSPGDELHDPTTAEGEVVRLSRVVHGDVRGRLLQHIGVFLEQAQRMVAWLAQQPADYTRLVIVVDVKGLPYLRLPTADGASATLICDHLIVSLQREPEGSLQMTGTLTLFGRIQFPMLAPVGIEPLG